MQGKVPDYSPLSPGSCNSPELQAPVSHLQIRISSHKFERKNWCYKDISNVARRTCSVSKKQLKKSCETVPLNVLQNLNLLIYVNNHTNLPYLLKEKEKNLNDNIFVLFCSCMLKKYFYKSHATLLLKGEPIEFTGLSFQVPHNGVVKGQFTYLIPRNGWSSLGSSQHFLS